MEKENSRLRPAVMGETDDVKKSYCHGNNDKNNSVHASIDPMRYWVHIGVGFYVKFPTQKNGVG